MEKPFLQYGFDLEISTSDKFSLASIEGGLFLQIEREDGTEIIARRRYIDRGQNTENLNVNLLSKEDKDIFIKGLTRLDVSRNDISKLLNVSYSSIVDALNNKRTRPSLN